MSRPTSSKLELAGAVGGIEAQLELPASPRGLAVIAHPHPLYGGSMDNKVVQTLAKACTDVGLAACRFNFRGVGASAGAYDEGLGETDDLIAVARQLRARHGELPLALAGFSFGGFVAARAAAHLAPFRLVLVAPAVKRFDVPEVPPGTLLLHGDLDEVVPITDTLAWARPIEQPVVVIPGADHFFHRKLHLIRRLAAEALREC